MARVTVEDCLEKEPNRFNLTLLAAKRARQLEGGKDALIDNTVRRHKDTVVALLEIAEGLVDEDMLKQSTGVQDNEAAIAEGLARMSTVEDLPSAVAEVAAPPLEVAEAAESTETVEVVEQEAAPEEAAPEEATTAEVTDSAEEKPAE